MNYSNSYSSGSSLVYIIHQYTAGWQIEREAEREREGEGKCGKTLFENPWAQLHPSTKARHSGSCRAIGLSHLKSYIQESQSYLLSSVKPGDQKVRQMDSLAKLFGTTTFVWWVEVVSCQGTPRLRGCYKTPATLRHVTQWQCQENWIEGKPMQLHACATIKKYRDSDLEDTFLHAETARPLLAFFSEFQHMWLSCSALWSTLVHRYSGPAKVN